MSGRGKAFPRPDITVFTSAKSTLIKPLMVIISAIPLTAPLKTSLAFSKDEKIYLYCRSGNRSGKAEQVLQSIGYINARNIGGINEASSKLQLKILQNR